MSGAVTPFNSHIDLLGLGEIQNAKFQKLASAPSPQEALFYYDTTLKKFRYYNGTEWVDGTKYLEGTGIDITNGTISVDDTVVALQTDIADFITKDVDDLTYYTKTADLPDVNDATLTIQKNGSDVATFGANASSNVTANITVPTKTSDLTNDDAFIDLTDLSIANSSTNYLEYDNTTGAIGAKVDTTVTSSSTNLVTSGAVASAIANEASGDMKYKGAWDITSATDYSDITLPVKAGYYYRVVGTGPKTIGGIEWNAGDCLIIDADVAAGGTISQVTKIDNTEGSDIVRLNATQTLTNKTIDADDNTIQDLELDNFKSGVVVTSVGSTGDDTSVPTEKAVRSAISTATTNMAKKVASSNIALTVSSGVCTWTITNSLGTADVGVHVYKVSDGSEVFPGKTVSSSTITLSFLASADIAANTYRAVIIG